MTGLLEGRTALVTGGANGVGRAIGKRLAHEGAHVIATDIDAAAGHAVRDEVVAAGGTADFIRADLAEEPDIERLFAHIVDLGRPLDVAVNNAAIDLETGSQSGRWDAATMERVWRVNVMGAFHCMRHELEMMMGQGRGAIVNISSLAGLVGVLGKPAYTASKHALIGLTRAAAIQYGPSGIRVNAVCPSAIRTDMLEIQGLDEAALIANHPLRRIAEPEDIADAALWLCSDQSRHITGHPLVIDAGRMAY